MRRLLKAIALLVVTVVVVPTMTAGTVLASFLFLPLPASVPTPTRAVEAQIATVYDIDGHEVGVFRQFDTTAPVQPKDIPAVLRKAVVASEDKRFYEHGGVDVKGTLRAMWADLRNRQVEQGGSTITQQYVKNAYVGKDRTLSRKIREAVLASQLDRQMSKEEILFRYLDQLYLGEGAYGVGAAAQTYFHKSVKDISLSEAALLTGIIPAPSYYNPRVNVAGAESKRKHVLGLMLEQGLITQDEYNRAIVQVTTLVEKTPPRPGQPLTGVYGRQAVRTNYPYFMDYVQRYLDAKYGAGFVYSRGLRIYTTLDTRLQEAAEKSIATTLSGTSPPLEMALASIEPVSGYVKALVGGRDFYAPGGQVNLALGKLGGGTGRQPGSGYKPFVLAEALEQGISPNKVYSGRNKICVTKDYCPENYGGESYGNLTLRQAITHSVNTVFVQLIRDVGVEKTMDLARKLGMKESIYKAGFHGMSVALGAPETSPLDMASAYGTWAARGMHAEPTPVLKVLDANDHIIEDNTKPKTHRVEREAVADTMNELLQGPLGPGGTAAGKGLGDRPAAGKTGTTNDNKDAWFTGYVPQLVTSVWIGDRDKPRTLRYIKGVRSVTGGTLPALTWQRYMKEAVKGLDVVKFSEPAPLSSFVSAAKRKARKGYDVGLRRAVVPASDGGSWVDKPAPPTAIAPTTTTTPPESTTTTTTPGLFGPPPSSG